MLADRLSISGKRGVRFESFVVVAIMPLNSTHLQSLLHEKARVSERMNE